MKKSLKILALSIVAVIALLPILSGIAIVSAQNPKKIPITFVRTNSYFTLGTDVRTTDGETYHTRNSIGGYYNYQITGDDVNLVGWSRMILSQNLDLKTGVGNQHFDSEIILEDGTFEGGHNVKGTFSGIYTSGIWAGYLKSLDTTTWGVWHGTGAYHGWTLTMESATGLQTTGYLMMPNPE